MEDRYHRYTLEEKMKKLFQEKRKVFLEDIPTLDFINSFPGFKDSQRQRIRARERHEGVQYANEDLLDYIMQKEEFWMKYLETAESICACSKTAALIHDVLNANPPKPLPPRRVSREYSEETDSTTGDFAKNVQSHYTNTCNEQRKKEMKFTHEETNDVAVFAESTLVTQSVEEEINSNNTGTQFSSKSVLANLCETIDDDEVPKVATEQEEENTAHSLTDACSKGENDQEMFRDIVVEDRQNESPDTNNVTFSSKLYLANLCELPNENQPSGTVKLQAKCTDKAADDNNLNRNTTQGDILKPVGQKDLHLSNFDNDNVNSTGENAEDEDSQSFILSDTDVISACEPSPDDDPSLQPEIENLKLEKKDQCMAANKVSCLLTDSITNEIDGNTKQSEEKWNAKLLASGEVSMSSPTRKEPDPMTCKQLNISSEDSSADNCFGQPTAKEATEREYETLDENRLQPLHVATCIDSIDQQPRPISAAVENQESVPVSPIAKYHNCIIINSHNCQIDSKGCAIKESGDRKISQGRTAQDAPLSLKYDGETPQLMLEKVNSENTANSNSMCENSEETLVKKPVVESIQTTSENYPEIENEDDMMSPTVNTSNQVESSAEGSTEYLSVDTSDPPGCCKCEVAEPEINGSGNNRPLEENTLTEKESHGETVDSDSDSKAGNRYEQSVKTDNKTFLVNFLPPWLKFEWNLY